MYRFIIGCILVSASFIGCFGSCDDAVVLKNAFIDDDYEAISSCIQEVDFNARVVVQEGQSSRKIPVFMLCRSAIAWDYARLGGADVQKTDSAGYGFVARLALAPQHTQGHVDMARSLLSFKDGDHKLMANPHGLSMPLLMATGWCLQGSIAAKGSAAHSLALFKALVDFSDKGALSAVVPESMSRHAGKNLLEVIRIRAEDGRQLPFWSPIEKLVLDRFVELGIHPVSSRLSDSCILS